MILLIVLRRLEIMDFLPVAVKIRPLKSGIGKTEF